MNLTRESPWLAAMPLLLLGEGWAVGTGHTKLAVFPLVVGLCGWLFARPWMTLGLALALLSIGGGSFIKVSRFYAPELVILFGFACLVVRGELLIERTGVLIGIFLVAAAGGVAVAEGYGLSQHDGVLDARIVVGYLAYWIALAGFSQRPDATFRVIAWVAAGIAALSIVQEVVGVGHKLFYRAGADVLTPTGNFLRVRPPGMLVYIAAFFALAYLVWGPRGNRRSALLLAALLLASVLISLNRNWALGLVIGILASTLIARKQTLSLARLTMLVLVGAVLLVGASGSAIGNRLLSLQNPSQLQQSTLSDRSYENGIAEAVLRKHPFLGVGWANYGAYITRNYITQPRSFIHNQYLGIWLRAGVIGLLAFVAALLSGLATAARKLRGGDQEDTWTAAAAVAALVGVAASAVVGIYFLETASAAGLVCLLAFCTVCLRGEMFVMGSPARE